MEPVGGAAYPADRGVVGAERGAAWSRVRARLKDLDDAEPGALLRTGLRGLSGHWGKDPASGRGRHHRLVKAVSLTEAETRQVTIRSTANLFGLPTYGQCSVGSPGIWEGTRST